jgi:hypothetical protein
LVCISFFRLCTYSYFYSETKVSLEEDGTVVGCENKVEFEVTGFRVHGKAESAHFTMGLSGITISLVSLEGNVIQSVETDAQGEYTLENVPSGEYSLHAEHPSWVISEPSTQQLSV